MEKPLGHHWKIRGKLMESMWDCWEILKESKEYWKGNQRGNHRKTIGEPPKIRGGPFRKTWKTKGQFEWKTHEITKKS